MSTMPSSISSPGSLMVFGHASPGEAAHGGSASDSLVEKLLSHWHLPDEAIHGGGAGDASLQNKGQPHIGVRFSNRGVKYPG